jgi:monothiol glutaredoxin
MSSLTVLKGGKGPSDGGRDVQKEIAEIVASHAVVLFMKGTPEAPRCGFSARAVEIIKAECAATSPGCSFYAVDVLQDPEIREGIKEFANWPTIPQAYVQGKFVGGSDILLEMHQSGELKDVFGVKS